MSSIQEQLVSYQVLQQQQFEQMGEALRHLHAGIAQQLEQLRQQEQALLEMQSTALAPLRSAVKADARCLLPTPQFEQFVVALLEEGSRHLFGSNRLSQVTVDPTTWLLATQTLPLAILSYELLRDESAYNDESYYTDYRYQLTARLGEWQQQVEASTASVHPGNPMSYYVKGLSSQHHDVAYRLLEADRDRPNADPQEEFADLNLEAGQGVRLKQEIGCLLTYVGNLFNLHSRVEHFRYPQQHWND